MQYIKNSDNSRSFIPETQDEIDALDYIDSTLGYSGLPKLVIDFVKQRQQQKTFDRINALHNQIQLLSPEDKEVALSAMEATIDSSVTSLKANKIV